MRRDLFERRRDGIPAVVADEVRVPRLAVGGEVLDRRVGEPRREQLLLHVLRRGGEARRAVDAVEARELAHRLERRVAVDLGVDRGRDLVGPERDRAASPAAFAAPRRKTAAAASETESRLHSSPLTALPGRRPRITRFSDAAKADLVIPLACRGEPAGCRWHGRGSAAGRLDHEPVTRRGASRYLSTPHCLVVQTRSLILRPSCSLDVSRLLPRSLAV